MARGIREAGEKVFDVADVYSGSDVLDKLFTTIKGRKTNPKEGSYTNKLFDGGLDKILKKVGEESAEVVIAAKNGSKKEIVGETADLLYHTLVMLAESGVEVSEVYKELKARQK